ERELEFEDDLSDRVDRLAEQITALNQEIEELRRLALQGPKTANKPRVVVEHTSDTLPSQNVPTARTGPSPYRIMVDSLDELPDDAIPLSEFAAEHGIENSKAFR